MKTTSLWPFVGLLEAQGETDLRAQLLKFTESLQFKTFSAIVVVDRLDAPPEFACIDNAPSAFKALHDNNDRNRRDPVMQHAKATSIPLAWNQSTYVAVRQGPEWEHQAAFGYCCGVMLALHMPNGRHFALGLDRDKSLPTRQDELSDLVARVQLFGVHAQEAATRIVRINSAEETPSLSPREKECLRWTMEGKTAWEVGRILGIAENTAVRHLYNASKKLGTINKHQAVLAALRMKLIR